MMSWIFSKNWPKKFKLKSFIHCLMNYFCEKKWTWSIHIIRYSLIIYKGIFSILLWVSDSYSWMLRKTRIIKFELNVESYCKILAFLISIVWWHFFTSKRSLISVENSIQIIFWIFFKCFYFENYLENFWLLVFILFICWPLIKLQVHNHPEKLKLK